MATAGLSLVGFMDQLQAINHLRTACIPADPSDAALISIWNTARANLGDPIHNCGLPNIQPISAADQPYIAQLMQQPWVQNAFQGPLLGASFQLIEIDPLLAFQFTIDIDRSNHHCASLGKPTSVQELLPICLPHAPPSENIQISPAPGSMMLSARNLSFRSFKQGFMPMPNDGTFLGLQIGLSLPMLHVVRHNGRCYLHNGFHRALGARLAGATHIPCVLRDVPDHAAVGINTADQTFQSILLESKNPPTLGHFTQGRAQNVSLRSFTRTLHVSWAEYITANE